VQKGKFNFRTIFLLRLSSSSLFCYSILSHNFKEGMTLMRWHLLFSEQPALPPVAWQNYAFPTSDRHWRFNE